MATPSELLPAGTVVRASSRYRWAWGDKTATIVAYWPQSRVYFCRGLDGVGRTIPVSLAVGVKMSLPLRCEFCGRDNSDDEDRCDCPELEESDEVA